MDSPLLARVPFAFECISERPALVQHRYGSSVGTDSGGAFVLVSALTPVEIWAGTKVEKRQSLAGKTQDTQAALASVVDVTSGNL